MKLKKGIKKIIFFLFLLIIVGLVVGYFLFYDEKKTTKKVKILKEIPEYGYQLSDNKTKEYKNEFYKLQKILKEDDVSEEKYVKSISKMFIYDFWTLENKIAKTDVGGSEFVHKTELEDFLEKSQDTIYKYLESNLYGNRKQELPYVSKVTIESVEQTPFSYGSEADEKAWTVKVNWKYKDSNIADGYQTKAVLIFVHEDKKLSLVELTGGEA